jgi:uncharacterized membrane protein
MSTSTQSAFKLRRHAIWWTLSMGLVPLLVPRFALGQGSFREIESLPDAAVRGFVNGMSRDGVAVVGGAPVSGEQAFLWTSAGGTTGLGDLPGGGFSSFATQAALGGQVVVGGSEYAPSRFQTFRWTADHGMQGLGFLPGGVFSHAIAVSDGGNIVIGQSDSMQGTQPFRWTPIGGMMGLGFLPGGHSSEGAFAMSVDGSVIVGQAESARGLEAFRWTAATGVQSLGTLSDSHVQVNYACAGNPTLSIVFGGAVSDESFPNQEAFRWTAADGMVGLGDLPGGEYSSIVYSSSADGRTAVGVASTDVGSEAFVWDPMHGMRNLKAVLVNEFGLDIPGWTLTHGVAVSADGRTFAGSGINPKGEPAGWIATIERPCRADFNDDGTVNSADFFDFLTAFFTNAPRADFNHDQQVNSQDFFDFLGAFFAPC